MENQIKDNNNGGDFYYKNRSNRVQDLVGGIFAGIVYVILAFAVISNSSNYEFYLTLFVIIYLIAITVPFFTGRYYISIGLISIFVVPLLIFGGCMMLIGI